MKEKKEKMKLVQIEEEKNVLALKKASRDFLEKLEKSNENSKASSNSMMNVIQQSTSVPAQAPVVVSSPPVSSKSAVEGKSTAENKAFDAGLLIAGPVIFATLGLFFFFPFLRDNLASSLPPLPDISEMQ
jgi:hypothetical protein